jgi:signal transduction histidine kinase
MRERAGLVGGTLQVQSQPEKGTQVIFRVPIYGNVSD